MTFNHLITACGGASPQGEAFGLVRSAAFDTKVGFIQTYSNLPRSSRIECAEMSAIVCI